MAPDQSNINPANKPNQIDREAKELVSALTHRLAELHYMGKSVHQDRDHEDDDDKGAKIITLAGSNSGAIMQGELMEEINDSTNHQHGFSSHDREANKNSTYANSNFQAINNSIMFNSNYTCDDPGVHIETTEFFDQINPTASYVDKIEKVTKKKVKGGSSKTKQVHDSDSSSSSSSSSSDEKGIDG